MNITIPVLYLGRPGSIEIILLPNGSRSINVTVEGVTMNMTQNGDVQYSLTGTIQGKLYKVLEERKVGVKNWRVRDFVLSIDTTRGEQKRLLQASGNVVDEICKVGIGNFLMCETSFLGKEFHRGENEYVYRNLDDVNKIHLI